MIFIVIFMNSFSDLDFFYLPTSEFLCIFVTDISFPSKLITSPTSNSVCLSFLESTAELLGVISPIFLALLSSCLPITLKIIIPAINQNHHFFKNKKPPKIGGRLQIILWCGVCQVQTNNWLCSLNLKLCLNFQALFRSFFLCFRCCNKSNYSKI